MLAILGVPLVLTRQLRLTRAAVPLVVIGGLCEVLGLGSFALGSRHGLAVSAVLASQFAALAALAGLAAFLLFRERLSRLQVSGVTIVAVGVAALRSSARESPGIRVRVTGERAR